MKEFPSFYDLKYQKSSRIFESEDIKDISPDKILKAEQFYDELVEKLEKGETIDEGVLGALIGGATGALVGPAIGKAICKVLGIDEKGNLGKLLTSRLVTTAIGATLGK